MATNPLQRNPRTQSEITQLRGFKEGTLGKLPGFGRKLSHEIGRRETAITRENEANALIKQQEQALLERQKRDAALGRENFRRGQNIAIGSQLGQARKAFEQQAGRRGLAFSGVEQAGVAALQAGAAAQAAQNLAQFQSQLELSFQQEREAFRRGEFNFVTGLHRLAVEQDFEREVLQFQANLAKDQAGLEALTGILQAGATIPFII